MLPLNNKRILITRTRHQASDLATQLEALGATPLLIPTIEIIPPETYAPLDAALAQLDTFDWLLFTSANAVEIFSQRIARVPDLLAQVPHLLDRVPHLIDRVPHLLDRVPHLIDRVPHLRDGLTVAKVGHRASDPLSFAEPQKLMEGAGAKLPKIAVIGPATAKAVQGIGLQADLIPPKYIAESLAESLIPEAPGKRMLLIRAEQARDILPETLTAAGAHVTIADAYRTQTPPDSIPALQSLFASPATYPDAITFTSASTARNLIALLEAANLTLPATITLASIGPITSQTLHDLGLSPHLEAAEPTIPALIQSLADHFAQ